MSRGQSIRAFVICKAGRPIVRVTALDDASTATPERRRLGLLRGQCEFPTTSIGWLPARSPICLKDLGRAADRRHASAAGYPPGGMGDGTGEALLRLAVLAADWGNRPLAPMPDQPRQALPQ